MSAIAPALEEFKPQTIFVSSFFDAHKDDFLANLNFTEADYRWVTEQIVTIADKYSERRIVSYLEGTLHYLILLKNTY